MASATRVPSGPLGARAFNHNQSREDEAEYERLRSLARQEHDKRSACFDKAHKAHERGDGRAAHDLSDEGKRHGEMMDQYNKQASEYIFRANNANDRVDSDTIDLHGQFVEEAEGILENRIRYARSHGQTHLHVIVGKGNHSAGHIQKIKPRVEQICQELGLQYSTEENAGRIYVNLQGGPAQAPPPVAGGYSSGHGGGQGQGYPHQQQQQYSQQPHAPHQQYPASGHGHGHGHQQGYGGSGPNQNLELEQEVKRVLPKILRKIEGCCIVM